MIKILFIMDAIVLIIALVFWIIGLKYQKNDADNSKGAEYILSATGVTGICIIFSAILFIPMFFPI
ncbi:hypothetical protein LL037_06090 [Clostridium estertheticum]|uniref:Uncharacterized protein n=1 Tax=Clostridium estertheticum TaxID=238834 RepID=A0AA47EFH7_9CLOT|nr:hypothetical protein [Clostridium estertheticum]MBU3157899.1 hypothetical protein [Clostridium estertheticum]MBU3202273.1 hypothetical protein [Clostridium estertheticum]WAG59249.1 hypothetical protein LL038_16590 [Clostridium estertheticum]WAG66697.1 hypothetical protein LL037_06090 [Clostridium estertheticum]